MFYLFVNLNTFQQIGKKNVIAYQFQVIKNTWARLISVKFTMRSSPFCLGGGLK